MGGPLDPGRGLCFFLFLNKLCFPFQNQTGNFVSLVDNFFLYIICGENKLFSAPPAEQTLKRYFVRITRYCGFLIVCFCKVMFH